MKYAITYTPDPKAAKSKNGPKEITFYTEDRESVHGLMKRGIDLGFNVTVREVHDGA